MSASIRQYNLIINSLINGEKKINIRKWYFILFLFIAVGTKVFSQNEISDWRFNNFNGDNHFLSINIYNIAFDKHGFVWTTGNGVAKFDGYKTIFYNKNNNRTAGFKTNYTDPIAVDFKGRIWVGSDGGLCYFDEVNEKFKYVAVDSLHPISYAYAFLLKGEKLWFVCNYGLAFLNLNSFKISITTLKRFNDPEGTYYINDSILLVTSRVKYYIYNILQNSYTEHSFTFQSNFLLISSFVKKDKQFYISTRKGLFLWENIYTEPILIKELAGIKINSLAFNPSDKEKKYLIIGTSGKGLKIFNTITKKVEYGFIHDDANPFSLSSNTITALKFDNNGLLWIGTSSGISMVDNITQLWQFRYLQKNKPGNFSVRKILIDKWDSLKMWMVVDEMGIQKINWKTKKVEKSWTNFIKEDKIIDLLQKDKTNWLVLTSKGLLEWNDASGKIKHIKNVFIPTKFYYSYTFRNLVKVNNNEYYITSNDGLFLFNEAAATILPVELRTDINEEESDHDLLNGFYDNSHILWIASRRGLMSFDVLTKRAIVYNESNTGLKETYFFNEIAPLDDNRIICATLNGIAVFKKNSKSFKFIHEFDDIISPLCYSVLHIKNDIWIASDNGIFIYNLFDGKSKKAITDFTFIKIQASSPLSYFNNTLIVGLRDGYTYIDQLKRIQASPSTPIISAVAVNNKNIPSKWLAEDTTDAIDLKYFENSINFNFTAFQFADPNSINFRYKLLGTGQEWVYTQDQRSANYLQLAPGEYVFVVQAFNKEGFGKNNTTSLNFTIHPPFWNAWWFRFSILLSLIFLGYSFYRYRIRQIYAVESVRKKIAADFHDEMGSTLTSISIYSDIALKQIDKDVNKTKSHLLDIGDKTRNIIISMNDMIWSVKPENDSIEKLVAYIKEYVIPLAEAKETRVIFNIDEQLLNVKLDMVKRKNLYFILKESLNNAIKYSNAQQLYIIFLKENKHLKISIVDDGIGFDFNKIKFGNGLNNIQRRVDEMKGQIRIQSYIEKGTHITIEVKIT